MEQKKKEEDVKQTPQFGHEMKNKTFFHSVSCAFRGMGYAFATEKNFLIYLFIALFFFAVNLICRVDALYFLIYLITVGGVISTELINTAIEHFADHVSDEISKAIKHVKDIAAAAVLFWGFIYFADEFLILWLTFH